MKKIQTILCGPLAALALAACSDGDHDIVGGQNPVGTNQQTWTVTTEARFSDADTRALSESGNVITASFATGENVYAYNTTKSTQLGGSLQPQAAFGNIYLLTGTLTGSIEKNDALKLIYPKATISYDGQKGTLEDLAANYSFATATVSVADASTPSVTTTAAFFSLQQSITKFTFNMPVKSLTISGEGLVKSISNSGAQTTGDITVTPDEPTTTVYVALRNMDMEADSKTDVVYTFSAVGTDDKPYAGTKKAALEAGKNYTTTVDLALVLPKDLSMQDCAGNARSTRWTANCYMVHEAGKYMLPLVYGNAIKNGETNTAAYTGVSGNNATATFPRHDGQPITAPWIKDNGITVASAELLWQDAPGLITDVYIENYQDGDYLVLQVDKDAATQEGNALIAAKDASGTVVWSWHIWVTRQTFSTLTRVVTSTPTSTHTYHLAPVNIGWTGEDERYGYSLYYQWGRKDAFPYKDNSHKVYNMAGNAISGMAYEVSTTATIADNIKHPTTFYYNSSNGGPCTTSYYNMWNAQDTRGGSVPTATTKTVYDPCPPGFCVPTYRLYGNIQSVLTDVQGNNNKYLGRTYNSEVLFPASGRIDYTDGAILNLGTMGFYWSASAYAAYGNDFANILSFAANTYTWRSYDSRAFGFPVRAVAESRTEAEREGYTYREDKWSDVSPND